MKLITNGRGNRKHNDSAKIFTIGEELSPQEKTEKSENIIRELKQEAAEVAGELQQAKFKQTDLKSRLSNLYWNCQVYNIKYKTEDIQLSLKMLDEQHDAEMQHKRLLFQVNKLSHKLKHGRNSLAEEMKIQRTMKCFDVGKNHQHSSIMTASEAKTRIPWSLVETVKSKESIKDISQALHHELLELGKRKEAYNKEARGIQRKLEAIEKYMGDLQGKQMDINSRINEVSTYLIQLKKTYRGNKVKR